MDLSRSAEIIATIIIVFAPENSEKDNTSKGIFIFLSERTTFIISKEDIDIVLNCKYCRQVITLYFVHIIMRRT